MFNLGLTISLVVSFANYHCVIKNDEGMRDYQETLSSAQCSANSSFAFLEWNDGSFSSGSIIQTSFELPENATSLSIIDKSDNLNVSLSINNNTNEGEILFQTPGIDGEYYASFNISNDNHNPSIGNAYIYSHNGIDVISSSSIEDAKSQYYLENVASEEDLILLGIEEAPNNFAPTKTEYEAKTAYEQAVHGNSDITMTCSSSIQNLNDKIRVTGTVTWYDKENIPHPLTGVLIELYDDDIFWNQFCDGSYTDSTGSFCLETEDEYFLEFFGRDLFLMLTSTTEAVSVERLTSDSQLSYIAVMPYTFSSQMLDSPCKNKEYVCDIQIYPNLSTRAAAFEICQAENIPYNYVNCLDNGTHLPRITVYYPNVVSKLFTETNYYFREFNYISICEKYYDDWDTLNHEYGHYICDYFNLCAPSFLTTHYVGDNLVETHGIERGLKLAMSEGLATYLGIASQMFCGTSLNVPDVGDEKYNGHNYSKDYSYYCYGENTSTSTHSFGEANELSVTSLLLKIMDDVQRVDDNISLGHQTMWNILRSDSHPYLSQLVQTIMYNYSNEIDNISLLLEKELFVPIPAPSSRLSTNQNDSCWTFSWNEHNLTNPSPDCYSFVIDDISSNLITINNLSSTSVTLTNAQINTVLASSAPSINWRVGCYHNYSNGTTTGPYYTSYSNVLKPIVTILSEGQSDTYYLPYGESKWFKINVLLSGTYCFESSSNFDMVGDIYEHVVIDSMTNNYLAKDDDSGQDHNFKLYIDLNAGQIIYLRARAFAYSGQGSFSVNVSVSHLSHNYSYNYSQHSSQKHKAYCSCGDFILENHLSNGNIYQVGTHRYTSCVYCGQQIDLNSGGPIIVGPGF